MTPDELAQSIDYAGRDRLMTRAERAVIKGRKPSRIMERIMDHAVSRGTVYLGGGYPGLPIYGGEFIIDEFVMAVPIAEDR